MRLLRNKKSENLTNFLENRRNEQGKNKKANLRLRIKKRNNDMNPNTTTNSIYHMMKKNPKSLENKDHKYSRFK